MVRQVVQAQCGIQFDNDAIARAGIPMSTVLGTAFLTTEAESNSPESTHTPRKKPKIQPTLHFFTEPVAKQAAFKDAARSASQAGEVAEKMDQAMNASSSAAGPSNSKEKDKSSAAVLRASEESGRSIATHSSAGTEIDAQQPIDDELSKNKWWWLLEIIPMSYTYQDGSGRWHHKWGYVLVSDCISGWTS